MIDYKSFFIQPIFVTLLVFCKNVLGDGYLPESPHVWMDVLGNIASFMTSKLIVELWFDKLFTSGLMENGFNVIVEPLVHGSINGLIKHMEVNTSTLNYLGVFRNLGEGKLPLPSHYSFLNGFEDGIVYNMMANYLSQPLIDAI